MPSPMPTARGYRCALRLAGLLIAGISFVPAGLPAPPDLDAVLASMDAAASKWTGLRAQFERVRYMSLVDDRSAEFGKIAVRRSSKGSVWMLMSFERPNTYYLSVQGTRAELYKPKIKTVEEYDLSGSQAQLENALLLGFGTAGSYLRQHYDITLAGDDDVTGHASVRLELQPKDPNGKLNNQRLEMWISATHWQPVRLKIYGRSSDDYQLQSYSEVEINPPFKASDFKLRLARGTSRVYPQR